MKIDGKAVEFVLRESSKLIPLAQQAIPIPFDRPDLYENWIQDGVNFGAYKLSEIFLDGNLIGTITWRIEDGPQRELVIVSTHIVKNDCEFSFVPVIELFARKIGAENGCKILRFHTLRQGLIKQTLKLGWHVSEFVMRKSI